MPTLRSTACALTALACGFLLPDTSAQSAITYPPGAESTDLPDLEFWALSPFAARRQVLIDLPALAVRPGSQLEAIEVRRDSDTIDGVLGGRVRVRLTVANVARSAANASEDFATNLGPHPSVVFDGIVVLPTLGPPATVPASWSSNESVRLPFSSPWRVTGPTVCFDTVTLPYEDPNRGTVDAPFWPIDLDSPVTHAFGQRAGISCVPSPDPLPAGLLADALYPGASAIFHLGHAPAHSALLCAIGVPRAVSLPLDAVGAPGCALHLDPLSILPSSTRSLAPGGPIVGQARVSLPALRELGGFELGSQWIAIIPGATPLGVVTSNRASGTIRLGTTPWETSWIESTDVLAPTGTLYPNRFPVMRVWIQ